MCNRRICTPVLQDYKNSQHIDVVDRYLQWMRDKIFQTRLRHFPSQSQTCQLLKIKIVDRHAQHYRAATFASQRGVIDTAWNGYLLEFCFCFKYDKCHTELTLCNLSWHDKRTKILQDTVVLIFGIPSSKIFIQPVELSHFKNTYVNYFLPFEMISCKFYISSIIIAVQSRYSAALFNVILCIDGLVRDCSSSIANTLQLMWSCSRPSI